VNFSGGFCGHRFAIDENAVRQTAPIAVSEHPIADWFSTGYRAVVMFGNMF
jgi:hypothetical protein